jgi:uncharacterized RDD family membrane protein YckC
MNAWRRFLARFFDLLILSEVVSLLFLFVYFLFYVCFFDAGPNIEAVPSYQDVKGRGLSDNSPFRTSFFFIFELVTALSFFLYHAFCISKFNTTLGKYALGLSVVNKQRQIKIPFNVALKREWKRFVSAKWGILQIVVCIAYYSVPTVRNLPNNEIIFLFSNLVLLILSLLKIGFINAIPMLLTRKYLEQHGQTKYDEALNLEIKATDVRVPVVCTICITVIFPIIAVLAFFSLMIMNFLFG